MRLYAGIAAFLGWFALSLQLVLMIRQAPAGAIVATVVNYFSFFTILSNLLVALALTASALRAPLGKGQSRSPQGSGCRSRMQLFSRPDVQSAVAVSISIVGVTYSLLLRELWNPQGAQKLADALLHDGMPAIYVLFWLLFVRKDQLRWRDPGVWLIYPAAYFGYILARGSLIGRYPYPFLDVSMLGYPRVLKHAGFFVLVFLGVGLLAVAIGRGAGKGRHRISAESD